MVARDFARVTNNNRDSDYPVYRVVSRTRQPSDDQEKKDLGGERGVTQVMGGEPYTGGLEHRLAHVKKFGSFAGKRISDGEFQFAKEDHNFVFGQIRPISFASVLAQIFSNNYKDCSYERVTRCEAYLISTLVEARPSSKPPA